MSRRRPDIIGRRIDGGIATESWCEHARDLRALAVRAAVLGAFRTVSAFLARTRTSAIGPAPAPGRRRRD